MRQFNYLMRVYFPCVIIRSRIIPERLVRIGFDYDRQQMAEGKACRPQRAPLSGEVVAIIRKRINAGSVTLAEIFKHLGATGDGKRPNVTGNALVTSVVIDFMERNGIRYVRGFYR